MKTLQQAYDEHQAKARELLTRLTAALNGHAGDRPPSWGHVGDLDGVCGRLIEGLGTLDALSADERDRYRI